MSRVAPDGQEFALTPDRQVEIVDVYYQLASRGERGLGFAECDCDRKAVPEDGDVLVELTGMIDLSRPEVPRVWTHNQNNTVAARAMADRKIIGHLS